MAKQSFLGEFKSQKFVWSIRVQTIENCPCGWTKWSPNFEADSPPKIKGVFFVFTSCFKCEQPGTKPQIYLFMADSKEEMDNWLRVLAAASRGEIIQKMPKQNQLSVKDEVVMRRKSGTNSAQRHSSILG